MPLHTESGFGRKDLIVLIACFCILGILIHLASTIARAKASMIKCVGSHRQIALALKVWSSDRDDSYPWEFRDRYTIRFQDPNNPWGSPKSGGYDFSQEGATTSESPRAWTVYAALSNCLVNPKVLLCPADRVKRMALASDFSTNAGGFFNNRVSPNGHHPKDWRQQAAYGRGSGYDNSVSYGIVRWNNASIRNGWKQAATPDQVLTYDYNVNRRHGHDSEFPNFDPLPGGSHVSDDNTTRFLNQQRSGAPTTSNVPIASWGWVVGKENKRFALHGADGGMIGFSDGGVRNLNSKDFEKISFEMYQGVIGAQNMATRSNVWAQHSFYQPW